MSGTRTLRAHVTLTLVVELPEDEYAADGEFDRICDAVEAAVTAAKIDGVYDGSVSVDDADTDGAA